MMPGRQFVTCSLNIWKMSWDILGPNGMCKNLYLPWWVLKLARYEDFSFEVDAPEDILGVKIT